MKHYLTHRNKQPKSQVFIKILLFMIFASMLLYLKLSAIIFAALRMLDSE